MGVSAAVVSRAVVTVHWPQEGGSGRSLAKQRSCGRMQEMIALLLLLLLAGPAAGAENDDTHADADAVVVTPGTVTIDEDDVLELQAENRQEKLERSIRRDLERTQNWSDDRDDD